MRYRFDGGREEAIYVSPEQRYKAGEPERKGKEPKYGFLTEENRRQEKRLQIPELNSGFDTVYWYRAQNITQIRADEHGCYLDWSGEGELPLTFAADVPEEGNYAVRIVLYSEAEETEAALYLGRRRLAWRGTLKREGMEGFQKDGAVRYLGEHRWEGRFVTNICPIIPRTYTEPMEDLTLDVTVLGRGIHLVEAEFAPWEGKTLYIAGDSTVTDQSADYPYLPGRSYCGWGQMLSAYLGEQMAVSNHSHSGLTTESFRSEGHYQLLSDRIRPGDVCLIQFGHNDQKLMHLKAEGGYRENLIRYIEEIRQKGAEPMLVTPLARNSWRGDDGTYNDLLEPYANACIRLSKEYGAPLLDLHKKSMEFVKACGRERAMRYFYPSDYTHSNDYGAYLFAGFVYEQMPGAAVRETEDWTPPEVLPQLTIPREYMDMEDPAREHLFEDLERPEEELTRVEALEMVIATMHFFPTNVYNDMFEDVIGHERYAGIVECAWQNGLIPKEMIVGRRFLPQNKITGEEFLAVLRNGYKSRKTWTAEQETALPEGFLAKGYLKRSVAAEMCRRGML